MTSFVVSTFSPCTISRMTLIFYEHSLAVIFLGLSRIPAARWTPSEVFLKPLMNIHNLFFFVSTFWACKTSRMTLTSSKHSFAVIFVWLSLIATAILDNFRSISETAYESLSIASLVFNWTHYFNNITHHFDQSRYLFLQFHHFCCSLSFGRRMSDFFFFRTISVVMTLLSVRIIFSVRRQLI